MATTVGIDVKGNLNKLKKAVSAVIKDDKAWVLALETFLEGPDPKSQVETIIQKDMSSKGSVTSPDQAIRIALDEVNFLQYLDNKLGRVLQLAPVPTSDDLSNAVKEAEAYWFVTNDAFALLQAVSKHCGSNDVISKAETAAIDRNVLVPLVKDLQSQPGVISPGAEPEGADLLLGKGTVATNSFLILLEQQGNRVVFEQTRKLFENKRFSLTDLQIVKLTKSWDAVIATVISKAASEHTPDAIGDILVLHDQLETLYDRLEANVQRASEDILVDLESPNI